MSELPRIASLGDSAVVVEFSNSISPEINQRAVALADHFYRTPFPGMIEAVPAYASTTIFYDPIRVRRAQTSFSSAFECVRSLVTSAVGLISGDNGTNSRSIEIPVRFDTCGEFDLVSLAQTRSLSIDRVIEIFTATEYRVYMLGFLPGFSYMGEVDVRIASPRLETPRTVVPKGSVGIAGRQTGIYSVASPGGWQIIGQTDVEMFTPDAELPAYLSPGDRVRFVPIDR